MTGHLAYAQAAERSDDFRRHARKSLLAGQPYRPASVHSTERRRRLRILVSRSAA